jgi:chromosome segregation ATPase
MNQMNNMKNIIDQMKNHIQLQNIKNKEYEIQINKIFRENETTKNENRIILKENEIIKNENDKMKLEIKIMKEMQMKMENQNVQMKNQNVQMKNQNVQMKKQIESLNQKIDSVNSNIIGRLDNVELNMKELKEIKDKMILNIQQDNNQLEQINHILQILDKIIADIDTMKLYVNGKIKENKEEIGKLMKEIDILKERIKELQNIIVSRK